MIDGARARPALIIGGAGFVGCNLADRLLREGQRVRVYDDLSRAGVGRNLEWLRSTHGDRVEIAVADVRDRAALRAAVADADGVFHLAGQVAVTTSLRDPRADFDVNARGTLELLEALRSLREPPPLIFTSTNKVYGSLSELALVEQRSRWSPADPELAAMGISERWPLSFRSPYGCSKGAADQYVLDYAVTFGLPAVVFRMSCIYGPCQRGTEDQGWVAHFLIRAIEDHAITVFGDGKQVRDVLYVADLVEALVHARAAVGELSGRAFNIGGGPGNTLSLLELLDAIEDLRGRRPAVEVADWRPGDQRWFAADTRAFAAATGWRARVSVAEGLGRLHDWLGANHGSASPAAPMLHERGYVHG